MTWRRSSVYKATQAVKYACAYIGRKCSCNVALYEGQGWKKDFIRFLREHDNCILVTAPNGKLSAADISMHSLHDMHTIQAADIEYCSAQSSWNLLTMIKRYYNDVNQVHHQPQQIRTLSWYNLPWHDSIIYHTCQNKRNPDRQSLIKPAWHQCQLSDILLFHTNGAISVPAPHWSQGRM